MRIHCPGLSQFVLGSLLLASAVVSVHAQPPGGDRGDRGRGGFGGGFGGPNLGEVLMRDEVQTELKLSDAQKQQIQGMMQGMRDDPDVQDIFGKLRNAQSDADRTAVFTELRTHFEGKYQKILSPDQYSRGQQLAVQRAGSRALQSDEVAAQLGISQQQKDQMKAASDRYDEARRALRDDMSLSDEQREARTTQLRAERDQAIEGVLNDSQRQTWTQKRGAEFQFSTDPGFGGRFGGGPGGAGPRTFGPAAAAPSTIRRPTGDAGSLAMNAAGIATAGPAVVSFGESVEPGKKVEKLKFNFRFAPWADVLKLFSESAGLTLDLNEVPPGTFNYYDSREYSPEEALDVINGYLIQKGFILVHRDEFLVVLNIDNGIPPNLVPTVPLEELPKRGRNELMTVIFPVEGIVPNEAAPEIAELLGPQGKAVALTKANKIVVTDIGANLRRVDELLKGMVVVVGDRVLKPFKLKYISALDAEKTVREVLGLPPRGVENVSAGAGYDSRGDSRYSRPPSPTPVPAGPGKTTVVADERTASLLVTATAADMRLVEETITSIDVPPAEGVTMVAGAPYLEVYQLKTADPLEVTKTISVLYPGTVLNEDGRSRRVHVQATAEQHRAIADMMKRLDGEGGGMKIAVVQLGRMDAYTAMASIQSMYLGDGTSAPTIQAHPTGRALMVRGTEDQVAEIQLLVTQLDPNDGSNKGSGKVRTVPLGGRDPQAFLRALEQVWEPGGKNPIRFVPTQSGTIKAKRVPSATPEADVEPAAASDPAAERTSSSQPAPARSETGNVESKATDKAASSVQPMPLQPAARPQPSASRLSESDVIEVSLLLFGTADEELEADDDQTASDDAPVDSKPASPDVDRFLDALDAALGDAPASAAPTGEPAASEPVPAAEDGTPIAVTISGGNLLIASQDEAALDRIEEVISEMQQSMPPQQQWEVMYLQSADATETATILERIFPSSSVSKTGASTEGFLGDLSGGLSSMGRGLMDMTGLNSLTSGPQTLRIIPDIRSNSLFVSGPPHMVEEVFEVLKILDASELPEQLRDRAPRYIDVKYADVNDVADILRGVFSEELEPPQSRQQQNNPLAAIMGGGSRGGDQRSPANKVKLTIGIDSRTSRLVVACSEPLFKQVQGVVTELDNSAMAARRTVRVVSLQHADSSALKGTLQQLMPRVKVNSGSSTSGRSGDSNSGSSGGSSGSSQPPQQPSPDQIRSMFQRGGGSPFGSGGGSPFGSGAPGGGGGFPFGGFGGSRGGPGGGR